jgi:hypothetical protein
MHLFETICNSLDMQILKCCVVNIEDASIVPIIMDDTANIQSGRSLAR